MDQFTPGQIVVMRQAWEMYRHKSGYSELFSLAEDGYSCKKQDAVPPPTPKPTKFRPKAGKSKNNCKTKASTNV